MSKTSNLSLSDAFIQGLNAPKFVFGRDSAGEAYDALPDPQSAGEGLPPPYTFPLGDYTKNTLLD